MQDACILNEGKCSFCSWIVCMVEEDSVWRFGYGIEFKTCGLEGNVRVWGS